MSFKREHLGILESRMAEHRRRMQIIMGPRQVGKSTLVGQYVDLNQFQVHTFLLIGA